MAREGSVFDRGEIVLASGQRGCENGGDAWCCFPVGSCGALGVWAAVHRRIVLLRIARNNITMKLSSTLPAFLAVSLTFVSLSVQAEPAFPGQPSINSALKHLTEAKEKAATDASTALTELEQAHDSLSHAIKKKGTYQPIARQLTEQATEYLRKGDLEKATHKIDEAIAAVKHAGETGEH